MLIKQIIYTWWTKMPSGRQAHWQHVQYLRRTTGSILRIDHSYKIVKCVGVQEGETWVTVKSSTS